jgi:septum site-determining protein MinC
MDKGYIENGFIVDLSHAKKTSEIIYELSRVLEMPESKGKCICLKLGGVNITQSELTSIKALVELMESDLSFISTSSSQTLEAATALDIKISEFTTEIEAPAFNSENAPEIEKALDNIFGEGEAEKQSTENTPQENESVKIAQQEDENITENEIPSEVDEETEKLQKEPETLPTLYIRRTLRSGQSISSDGNIIVIGDVNPGAEIIAKGDVTVWGVLSGIAHAGSDGNNYARIRALKLNPVQIRIGEIFARRPDTVNIPYIQKTSEFTPEEAYTSNGNIIIKRIQKIKEI